MVKFLAGARDFSLLHSIQTGSGDHPAPYPISTGAPFLELKWPGHEADHLRPSSAEVKNVGTILPPPPMSSWLGVQLSTGPTSPFYLYNNKYVQKFPSPNFIKNLISIKELGQISQYNN
jgi:hypothetical protein